MMKLEVQFTFKITFNIFRYYFSEIKTRNLQNCWTEGQEAEM